jgi:rod shape-determining protein MreD
MSVLFTFIAFLIGAALQARLPTLWWLGGMRIELLPALVVYTSLTLPRGSALFLALAAGATQDALSAGPFGLSMLAYGISATLMTAMRGALDRDLPWVQMGGGALTSAAVSIAACCVAGFSTAAVGKIAVLALLSGIVAPFLFFGADYARLLWRSA